MTTSIWLFIAGIPTLPTRSSSAGTLATLYPENSSRDRVTRYRFLRSEFDSRSSHYVQIDSYFPEDRIGADSIPNGKDDLIAIHYFSDASLAQDSIEISPDELYYTKTQYLEPGLQEIRVFARDITSDDDSRQIYDEASTRGYRIFAPYPRQLSERENARIELWSPEIVPSFSCSPRDLSYVERSRNMGDGTNSPCDVWAAGETTVDLDLTSNFKVDSARGADSPEDLTWIVTRRYEETEVSALITDLARERLANIYLFWSAGLFGLAGAIAPLGVERLVRSGIPRHAVDKFARWRRSAS